MAIEQTVITDKLKEEGIDENLGNGLVFETEENLTTWVGTYKAGLPEPVKKLEDYTKEELDELSKDPTFKGAKGLQGYTDSIRQKKKPETPPVVKKPEEKEPEWAKTIREQNEKILTKNETEAFSKTVERIGKAESLNDVHISRVKKGLKTDATEAEIETEIKAYKKELSEAGIKEFGTPGGGKVGNSSKVTKAAEAWRDKHKKKNEKK